MAFKCPQNCVLPEGLISEAFLSEHGCNACNRSWTSDAFWYVEGCAVIPLLGKCRLPFRCKHSIPQPAKDLPARATGYHHLSGLSASAMPKTFCKGEDAHSTQIGGSQGTERGCVISNEAKRENAVLKQKVFPL